MSSKPYINSSPSFACKSSNLYLSLASFFSTVSWSSSSTEVNESSKIARNKFKSMKLPTKIAVIKYRTLMKGLMVEPKALNMIVFQFSTLSKIKEVTKA